MVSSGVFSGLPLLHGQTSKAKTASEGTCELTTETINGPYYVDDVFVRNKISELCATDAATRTRNHGIPSFERASEFL